MEVLQKRKECPFRPGVSKSLVYVLKCWPQFGFGNGQKTFTENVGFASKPHFVVDDFGSVIFKGIPQVIVVVGVCNNTWGYKREKFHR